MIIAALPVGASHGWGVVGMGIARELARLDPGNVRLMTQQFTPDAVGDELVFRELAALLLKADDISGARVVDGVTHLGHPLLTCATDKQFTPISPEYRGARTVGHAVFEENILQPAWLDNARRYFDIVATASSWCTQILRDHGLAEAKTVVQGIDPRLFHPLPADLSAIAREFLADKFVIFSGGKFEFRKAQDVVIRAVKVLQDRHPDVVLINAWFNPWPASFESMKTSPLISLPSFSGNYVDTINRILAHNGLDLNRVVTCGPRTNALMARIYRNSDIGLFPNRCEGGTNLVMMEYMACGKPVVATASCGHADVIRPNNALIISTPTENQLSDANGPVAHWPEPSLDDTITKLEEAYQQRGLLYSLGHQAGRDLANFSWSQSARKFHDLLTQ